MTFLDHLEELRKRIFYSLIALCVAAVVGFFFSQRVTDLLTRPVPNLVFLAPAEAFVVQLKVALAPAWIDAGVAAKLEMTGGLETAVTVTVAWAVRVPPAPLAVRV